MKKLGDPGQTERVEYLSISKRIGGQREQKSAPVVDVGQYRRESYVPPEQVRLNPEEFPGGQWQ